MSHGQPVDQHLRLMTLKQVIHIQPKTIATCHARVRIDELLNYSLGVCFYIAFDNGSHYFTTMLVNYHFGREVATPNFLQTRPMEPRREAYHRDQFPRSVLRQ